jgi:hypothetical protein
MRLFGVEVHSCHTALVGHECADHLLADHDEVMMAIVWKTGRTHTVSHSRSVKANHAHGYLPRCACEPSLVEEVAKPPRTKDVPDGEAEAVAAGE